MDAIERSVRSWVASQKDAEVQKLVEGVPGSNGHPPVNHDCPFRRLVRQRHFSRYCQGSRGVLDGGRGSPADQRCVWKYTGRGSSNM